MGPFKLPQINALPLKRSKMLSVNPQQKVRLQPMVRPQFQLVEFLLLRMSYDYTNSVPSTTRFIPKYPRRRTLPSPKSRQAKPTKAIEESNNRIYSNNVAD